jgi:uncharacterized protein YcnI
VIRRLVIGVVAAAGMFPAAAQAHIQVSPKTAAPGDAVKFTVLVPGERDSETVKVELQMPHDLLPFSYEETPGWKRELVKASNGAVERVVWTGRAPSDGFVEFSFLAGTPEKPGELEFKALQTYADGNVVRWIGAPDADNPAAVVKVDASAAKQNAGGESAGRDSGGAAPAATATEAAPAATVAATAQDDGGGDTLALVLGGAGLLLGAVALAVSVRTARRRPSETGTTG